MDNLRYIKISENPVEEFLRRIFVPGVLPKKLVIITPLLGSLANTRYPLSLLRQKIEKERILTCLITRKPVELFHMEAVEMLMESDFVEVRYNNALHAKLYICIGEDTGFAMLGSGNLTQTSLEENIEIGMLIRPYEKGREILHQLYYWGLVRLRTMHESKLEKKWIKRR